MSERDTGGGAEKARRAVRARIQERIDAVLADEHEFQVPEMADELIDWIAHRPPLASQFLTEAYRGMVAQEIRSVVGSRRGSYIAVGPDEVVDRQGWDTRVRVFRTRWATFTERVGMVQKPVMKMTRRELEMAAVTRETAADRDLLYARLWRELARPLRGNQTVDKKWSEDQITALEERLKVSNRIVRPPGAASA